MGVKQLIDFLPSNIIKFNQFLKDYTTFGVGGKVLAVLEPSNKKELIKCVKVCHKLKLKYQVIGNGSNILASSKNTRRVIITTRKMESAKIVKDDVLQVNAGAMISEVILWCAERGYSGLENLYGIPATIGGMVMMNAGAFGSQIFDNLISVEVLDSGVVKILKKEDIEFCHHFTSLLKTDKIILSVKLSLSRLAPSVIYSKCKQITLERNKKQPVGKSAGSVFRPTEENVPAGKLIDEAGLKGLRVGNAVISEKHANFILNLNKATDKDIKKLISVIQIAVKEQFGIKLKREIEYLGDRDDYYRWLSHT